MAKSIADRIDYGCIIMPVTEDDKSKLLSITSQTGIIPNLSFHIYKNRGNAYKAVKLWCSADLGTCRINPLFMTNNNHELIPIEDTIINIEE